ncbi:MULTISPECIES: hypothetical protein [Halococcus]|uniref:Uncharacterized protein n=1 Tax=Halococcus salifodinae DSM 8989 TaxID=1227456 RepID=M0MX91_9EURY|nr:MULTISPECIES: hypothetical protein [Halococcus]EMA49020.1 hypothetical protein C450_18539 [Halococcus salifodinae DSM 8989]
MPSNDSRRQFFVRVSVVVAVATLFLTASFVGLLALLNGDLRGSSSRIAWYLTIAAVAFVGVIILLETQDAAGTSIITTAAIVAVIVFVLVSLGVEGLLYAVRNPAAVFVSQTILYFFAAALIGSGVGYWALRHWREVVG